MDEHVPFSEHTTFKLGGQARYFFRVRNIAEARKALSFAREKTLSFFVLGGGSNLLVSDKGFSGVVIKNEIKGVEWIEDILNFRDLDILKSQNIKMSESQNFFLVRVGAGENWDNFVSECVNRGLYGLENLSGIPGTVGAAPVQNIGAYGAEAKDSIVSVEALDSENGQIKFFSNADCGFGYRDSFFKTAEGKRHIIISVTFLLKKIGNLNLNYKDLKNYFSGSCSPFLKGALPLLLPEEGCRVCEAGWWERQEGFKSSGSADGATFADVSPKTPTFKKGGIKQPTLAGVRKAVLEIRSKKFPDLKTTGTAGSFFKNPIIPQAQFDELKKKFPDLPGFEVHGTKAEQNTERTRKVKLPLAWILDNVLHLKGFMNGSVGLHEAQPLVIVHQGGGKAEDVRRLAKDVADGIKDATGIEVSWEVEYLG